MLTSLIVLLLLLALTACLRPDPIESGTVVDVSYVDVLETEGYARDVVAYGNKIFVAASQAGNQIWEAQNGTAVKVFEPYFSDNPALKIILEPHSRLLFTVDKDKAFYKKLNPELSAFDSVYILHPVWSEILEDRFFGDGSIEDIFAREINDSLVAVVVSDRSEGDGLQQNYFNKRYHSTEGFYYWEKNNVGSSTAGKHLGLDLRDTLIAVTRDELGVILYRLEDVDLDTLAEIDTPGSALEVLFYDNYLLVANNWAGMEVISLGPGDSSLTHLANIEVSGWVKQISIWNDIAILSCGENGVFLVDLSDPEHPRVDQAIDAGYTYRTYVANDMLYAATREGVKRYHIESR